MEEACAAACALFETKFLVDPCNLHWRNMVMAEDGRPQPLDPRVLLTFSQVTDVLPLPHNAAALQGLLAAISRLNPQTSPVHLLNWASPTDATATPTKIIRAAPLDLNLDPDRRTVFVKPVHTDATDADVSTFFSQFGNVERVERRVFIDYGKDAKVRSSVFVVFSTVAEALVCVKAKPSLPLTGVRLADTFLPKLVVTMKQTHDQQAADSADRDFSRAQRDAAEKAELPTSSGNAATAVDALMASNVTKFLLPGHTCVIRGLQTNASWSVIKTRLGELCSKEPSLRAKIALVHVVDGGSNLPATAYVVLRSSQAAQQLLTLHRSAVCIVNATQRGASVEDVAAASAALGNPADPIRRLADILRFVPSLELASGEEETRVIAQYSEWIAPKVSKKHLDNRHTATGEKRPRQGT